MSRYTSNIQTSNLTKRQQMLHQQSNAHYNNNASFNPMNGNCKVKDNILQVHASLPWTVIDPRTDDILLPFHRNAAYCTNAPGGLNNSLYVDYSTPILSKATHLRIQLLLVTGEEVPSGQQQVNNSNTNNNSSNKIQSRIDNESSFTSLSSEKQKLAYLNRLDDTINVFDFNEQQPVAELIVPIPAIVPTSRKSPTAASKSNKTIDSSSNSSDDGIDESSNTITESKQEWFSVTNNKTNKSVFTVKLQRVDNYDSSSISPYASDNDSNLVRLYFKYMINSGQYSRCKFSFKIIPLANELPSSTLGGEFIKYTFPVFVMSKKNTIGTNAVTSLVCEKINLVSNNLRAQKMQKIKLAENSRAIIANSLADVIKLTGCAREVAGIIDELVAALETNENPESGAPSSKLKRTYEDVNDNASENDNSYGTGSTISSSSTKKQKIRDASSAINAVDNKPSSPLDNVLPIKKFKIVAGIDMKRSYHMSDPIPIPDDQPIHDQHSHMDNSLSIEPLLSIGSSSWIRDNDLAFQNNLNAFASTMKLEPDNGNIGFSSSPLPPTTSNSFILPYPATSVQASQSFVLSPAPTASSQTSDQYSNY